MASAGDVSWSNSNPDEALWEQGANWNSGVAPAPGDTVTIGMGNAGLYTDVAVDTVTVEDGTLWINRNGVLNADTVNVTGGQLALSRGNLTAATNPGPQGIVNISTLLNITGGAVDRFGLIDLGESGAVVQSGGVVNGAVQIHAPSYVQTGGAMGGQATASTYSISGSGSEMTGAVYLSGQFTMADGALVTGWVAGDGGAAMVQTGGAMEGSASGLATYTQNGGLLAGTVVFSDLFELSGTGEIVWAPILGSTEAAFNQSAGTMGGDVYAPVGSEDWTAIAKYSQTGGDMTGVVTTRTYEASGGTITGMVEFAELFVLSGDASVGYTDLNGDGDAAMTQSGGTMGAWVTGIDTYSQSGGDMTEWVTADTYEASGGNISGKVDFSELFALSGDAVVNAGSELNGDGDAAMTQSGGMMEGEVGGISTYTMSGGTLAGVVNFADHFEFSGGQIDFVDILGGADATMTQTGGTLNGVVWSLETDDYTIAKYTQTAGEMASDYVYARNYEMSGGTLTGNVFFTDTFELLGGEVSGPADRYIEGLHTGTVIQSGGTMSTNVIDIVHYAQSGGEMTNFVATDSYDLSGGSVSGRVNFVDLFTLSGDGDVIAGTALSSYHAGQMEQSGGTMSGHVNGITTYTQSGGVMDGGIDTVNYAQSGGTLSGDANFGQLFALSGTGSVTNASTLTGDGTATATQAGGIMDGTLTGITSYAQSGGTMDGKVTAPSYSLSGGSLGGEAGFATLFALSGDGVVVSTGTLVGGSGSTATQSGGTMDGTVTGVTTYAQSGGGMGGDVTSASYALSAGALSGDVDFSTQFALSGSGEVTSTGKLVSAAVGATVTQSAGTFMAGSVSGSVASYTQSGGMMSGSVTTTAYEMSGGILSGDLAFSSFLLSGDQNVVVSGHLAGAAGSVVTQVGGQMNGHVSGVSDYLQGGRVGPTAVIEFARLYALSDGFQLDGGAHVVGGISSVMAQSGGTMEGSVSGVASYAQSGGKMTGSVSTGTYSVSADEVMGTVTFSDSFALSGTGLVTGSGVLSGGTGSTMLQAGGGMSGMVSGLDLYAQSGGDMGYTAAGVTRGSVSTASYELSGGNVAGQVTFSTLFALSDAGAVTSSALLAGDNGSIMTQSAGPMAGTVSGVIAYDQSGGTMSGGVSAGTYTLSAGALTGQADVATLFALSGTGSITSNAMVTGGGSADLTQSGGAMNGTVTGFEAYAQSGGTMDGRVVSQSYELSAGTFAGQADFAALFDLSGGAVGSAAQLVGGTGSAMTQSNGVMDGTVTGLGSYTQTAGAMTGSVTGNDYVQAGGSVDGLINVATYSLTAPGTTAGTIIASGALNLGFDGGDATVDARLSGAASVVKSGTSTVVLANGGNDFSGGVAVDGGVLEVRDGALPGEATINLSNSATLRFNTAAGASAQFDGIMTGDTGVLEKTGAGTLTLGGDIYLGALQVNGGALNIGNGAPEEASFDSAYIEEGATLYVASGATLRVRIPKNIVNFGNLFNDGTVYDDLDNAGRFVNNAVYVANVASNTDDIANNSPGVWTGDILANSNWINNNENATWNGNVVTNNGRVANGGGIWRGDILANASHIINDNRADEIGTGYWIGDVVTNNDWIFNGGGGDWTVDIRSNANHIMNDGLANWTGDVLSNSALIWNGGTWTGRVLGNANTIHNAGGTWTGDVGANTGTILNTEGTRLGLPTGASTWNGNVVTNARTISNGVGSFWNGSVMSNAAAISNNGTWTGTVVSNGIEGVDPGLDFGKLIYNSATGSWNGDVEKNYSWIFNEGGTWRGAVLSNDAQIWNDNQYGEIGTGYWIGDVVGNAGTIFNGGGGNWTGDILGNSRSGHIKNDAPAVWTGSVFANAGVAENHGIWTGDVVGNAYAVINEKTWNGAVIAAGTQTSPDTGNVPNTGNTGILINANAGVWTGDVQGNLGTVDNRGGVWNGTVLSNAGTITNAAGVLNRRATGNATWVGNVQTNAGIITNAAGSSWTGNVLGNTGTIATAGTWTGNLTNAGTVNAQGVIAGAFSNSGLLQVTGSLAGLTTLTNSGQIDMRNSSAAQVLSVNEAVFGAGSTFGVDIDGNGNSDRIVASGNASLGGAVHVATTPGAHGNVTNYTLVSAGSISGTFAAATSDLAFLTPVLRYDATSATIVMTRNDLTFEDVGETPNQQETGGAIDTPGTGTPSTDTPSPGPEIPSTGDPATGSPSTGNPISDAIVWLTPTQAQAALQQLSGEAYASAGNAALQGAGAIGNVMQGRIDQSFDALGDTSNAVSGYAGDWQAPADAQTEIGLWSQIYGVGASNSGGPFPLHSTSGGLALGSDGMLGDWRLGAMLQVGASGSAVPTLNSTVSSTDYGAGLYAGTQWGATQVSVGGGYTLHDTRSERTVTFPGFSNALTASYLAGTAQAFGEISHEFDFGAVSVTPFAGLAHVRYASGGFTEVGGPAALSRATQVLNATFASLGLAVEQQFVVGEAMLLTASGSVGFRHVFTDAPTSVHSFGSGPAFNVTGTPIASDVLTVGAGLDLDVGGGTNLNLSYDGQVGSGTQTHAVQGIWSQQF